MNEPTYKIHGIERRQLKKELSELKSYVKNFWHCHQLDKDMTSFYGGKEGYPMSDDEAQKKVDKAKKQIKQLEDRLSVLYVSDSHFSEFCCYLTGHDENTISQMYNDWKMFK